MNRSRNRPRRPPMVPCRGEVIPPTKTKQTRHMRPTKTERYLRCHFTDAELLGISKEMSQNVAQRAQAENDKKRMAKEFDARIATMDAAIDLASEKVRSGYECRNVACSVTYNSPKPGMKEVRRDDTGELVEAVMMTSGELQEELPFSEAKPGEVIDAEIPTQDEPKPQATESNAEAIDAETLEIIAEGDIREGTFAENLVNANAATVQAAIMRTGGTGKRGKALKARLEEIANAAQA